MCAQLIWCTLSCFSAVFLLIFLPYFRSILFLQLVSFECLPTKCQCRRREEGEVQGNENENIYKAQTRRDLWPSQKPPQTFGKSSSLRDSRRLSALAAWQRKGRGGREKGSGVLVVVLFWRLQIVSHESFESYESNEFNSIELSSKRSLSLSFRLSPNSNEGRCQPDEEVHDDDNDGRQRWWWWRRCQRNFIVNEIEFNCGKSNATAMATEAALPAKRNNCATYQRHLLWLLYFVPGLAHAPASGRAGHKCNEIFV